MNQGLEFLFIYAVIGALSWWLRPYFLRFGDIPASQLNQTFFEYWPGILWALLFQALTIVLGGFLFNGAGLWFIWASFYFWLAFIFVALPLLFVVRLHPGRFVKFAVSVMPLLIFSVFYFLELHQAR